MPFPIQAVIDAIDSITSAGLSGTNNSLGYRVNEIEKHFHNSEQIFGNAANAMLADEPVKFTVTGGDDVWGTELMLTDGTVIESGSATKKFDLNTLYIVSVSAANKISVVEFLYSAIGTPTEITDIDHDGGGTIGSAEYFKAAASPTNGTKVVLTNSGGALPTGVNGYTVYYTISKDGAGAGTFQLSLTSGGAAVTISDNGSGTSYFTALTQTSLTKTCVSMAATNSDAFPFPMIAPRIACNSRVFVRAKSETGSTIAIGFLIGLHTYTA